MDAIEREHMHQLHTATFSFVPFDPDGVITRVVCCRVTYVGCSALYLISSTWLNISALCNQFSKQWPGDFSQKKLGMKPSWHNVPARHYASFRQCFPDKLLVNVVSETFSLARHCLLCYTKFDSCQIIRKVNPSVQPLQILTSFFVAQIAPRNSQQITNWILSKINF